MKKTISILLVICMCLSVVAMLTACGDKQEQSNDTQTRVAPAPDSQGLEFEYRSNCYYVSGIGTCTDTLIVIPSTHNGLPVGGIADGAFSINYNFADEGNDDNGNEKLKSNSFGNSITLLSATFALSDTTILDDEIPVEQKITEVFIPDSVLNIGDSAFYGCTSLSDFDAPRLMSMVGTDAFKNTAFYLDEKNWTDGVLYLDTCLVEVRAEKTGKLAVKDGTTIIAKNAARNCTGITEIEFPQTLRSIDSNAFSMCTALEKVNLNIPGLGIGSGAFEGCSTLVSVVIGTDDAPTPYDIFLSYTNSGVTGGAEYQPPSSGNNLNEGPRMYGFFGSNWMKTTDPSFIFSTYIGTDAFKDCTSLTSVEFASGVRYIADYAFSNCTALSTVDMRKITVITDYNTSVVTTHFIKYDKTSFNHIFEGCSSLAKVTLPENLERIDNGMFSGCVALDDIVIPSTVIEICDDAFNGVQEITYQGTLQQWAAVKKGNAQSSYVVHCVDGDEIVEESKTTEES